jgi:hypothetical protein
MGARIFRLSTRCLNEKLINDTQRRNGHHRVEQILLPAHDADARRSHRKIATVWPAMVFSHRFPLNNEIDTIHRSATSSKTRIPGVVEAVGDLRYEY